MNKNDLYLLIGEYKKFERMSHVSLDDIINKVTQEVGELVESSLEGDNKNMYKEASDTLINVLSVARELGLDLDFDGEKGAKPNTLINLPLLNSKWNQKIQSLRGRYTRDDVSIDEVNDITNNLVKEILNYADPDLDLELMIKLNTKKIESRVLEYKQDINIKDYIVSYPDFPKKGIDFKDIGPILGSPQAFRYVCMEMVKVCSGCDVIVGLDSRGFLFGTMVAEYLGKPFVMVRKAGKLPGDTIKQDYGLEYGNDVIEIQKLGIKKGQKVSIIDDLLATGGTAKATIDLIESLGGEVNNLSFVISLDNPELVGSNSRQDLNNYNLNSIISYS